MYTHSPLPLPPASERLAGALALALDAAPGCKSQTGGGATPGCKSPTGSGAAPTFFFAGEALLSDMTSPGIDVTGKRKHCEPRLLITHVMTDFNMLLCMQIWFD